ncbi:MAG: hypothetical protein M1812_005785 [Candelaria pacifica]|nr:MAG: hypothetical protein M1812_005785 [Candelaria pacifica]
MAVSCLFLAQQSLAMPQPEADASIKDWFVPKNHFRKLWEVAFFDDNKCGKEGGKEIAGHATGDDENGTDCIKINPKAKSANIWLIGDGGAANLGGRGQFILFADKDSDKCNLKGMLGVGSGVSSQAGWSCLGSEMLDGPFHHYTWTPPTKR